jgi:FdrA protein
MKRLIVKPNTYQDSFNLMLLAIQVQELPGVMEAALLMGTAANKKRLEKAGYSGSALNKAQANDLIVALDLQSEEALQATLRKIDIFLTDGRALSGSASVKDQNVLPRSLESALSVSPEADIVSISVPGEYAGVEARKALQNGLHVFLFSDHVPLAEEVALKQLAWEKGLLLMGPDCGTARIGGLSLGFCNLVKDGAVGMVAASGTGAQEVMSLLDRRGVGISHVLGTGGRDLNPQVGGISSSIGLNALEADPKTKVIVYISKPADPTAREKLARLADTLTKPLVVCFIGEKVEGLQQKHAWVQAANLEHAAQLAASFQNGEPPIPPLTIRDFYQQHQQRLSEARASLALDQKQVRGLYSGGSLADEAALILAQVLPDVHAGNGFENVLPITKWERSSGNRILDMGEDRFTQGRPHPMIDSRSRLARLRAETQDPAVGVLLLDVVLGLNAHPNPAAELSEGIAQAQAEAARHGRSLYFLVHVCGTDRDPQGYARQVEQLEQAGGWVFESNAQAAMAAVCLLAPRVEDI